MWTYKQVSGCLDHDGAIIGVGYSGAAPLGKNNPSMQNVRQVGPIPQGMYTIEGPPFDSPLHGPFCLRLIPDAENEMFGRDGFLLHGDSIEHPGCASEGCICQGRATREKVWSSGDLRLKVSA